MPRGASSVRQAEAAWVSTSREVRGHGQGQRSHPLGSGGLALVCAAVFVLTSSELNCP